MNYLIYIHVVVTFLLALVILVQKSEGGASLFSSSASMSGAMTARGAENFLTKCTWVLAAILVTICLAMGAITKHKYNRDNAVYYDKSASAPVNGGANSSDEHSVASISDNDSSSASSDE